MSQELPIGKRFFKTNPKQAKLMDYLFEGTRLRNIMDAFKDTELPESSSLGFFKRISHITYDAGNYPIVSIHTSVLSSITGDSVGPYTSHLKANLGGETRMSSYDIPYTKTLRMQWCEQRKGLIFYDMPYEGPVISGKIGTANTHLREYVSKMHDVIKTAALVGAPIEYTSEISGLSSEGVLSGLTDIFKGKKVDTDSLPLLYAIGAVERKWGDGSTHARNKALLVPAEYIKISPAVRARALFNAGIYTLPEDYEQWFDG